MQTKCVWCIGFCVVASRLTYHTCTVHTQSQSHVHCTGARRAVSYSWNQLWCFLKHPGLVEICFRTWIIHSRSKCLIEIHTDTKNATFGIIRLNFFSLLTWTNRKFVCLSSFLLHSVHEPNQTLIKKLSAANVSGIP